MYHEGVDIEVKHPVQKSKTIVFSSVVRNKEYKRLRIPASKEFSIK